MIQVRPELLARGEMQAAGLESGMGGMVLFSHSPNLFVRLFTAATDQNWRPLKP
jgi:hypothetical protein